jgi:hypothetical protein
MNDVIFRFERTLQKCAQRGVVPDDNDTHCYSSGRGEPRKDPKGNTNLVGRYEAVKVNPYARKKIFED